MHTYPTGSTAYHSLQPPRPPALGTRAFSRLPPRTATEPPRPRYPSHPGDGRGSAWIQAKRPRE